LIVLIKRGSAVIVLPQLVIIFCLEKAASEEMRSLREKLPSGSALTALQNHNSFRDEYGMSSSSTINFCNLAFLPVF
jgi:hypothetical protein